MSIDAMKQALDALEQVKAETSHPAKVFVHNPAIEALRQAIEQVGKRARSAEYDRAVEITELYERAWKAATAEQAEQAQPVRHQWGCRANAFGECNMGCATPPQRKPLTDWEIRLVYGNDLKYRDGDYIRFARAIEAAHGIKGEA
jgi:hypothetical protein